MWPKTTARWSSTSLSHVLKTKYVWCWVLMVRDSFFPRQQAVSAQIQPTYGMDFTWARCGLDLGQNYVVVWVASSFVSSDVSTFILLSKVSPTTCVVLQGTSSTQNTIKWIRTWHNHWQITILHRLTTLTWLEISCCLSLGLICMRMCFRQAVAVWKVGIILST